MPAHSLLLSNSSAKKTVAVSRIVVFGLVASLLAGCANAPAVYAFGSYFPSWLLCAIIGIIGAVLVRVIFIFLQLDDYLPLRLLVYIGVALIIAIATSLAFFST